MLRRWSDSKTLCRITRQNDGESSRLRFFFIFPWKTKLQRLMNRANYNWHLWLLLWAKLLWGFALMDCRNYGEAYWKCFRKLQNGKLPILNSPQFHDFFSIKIIPFPLLQSYRNLFNISLISPLLIFHKFRGPFDFAVLSVRCIHQQLSASFS
jgi:hypothetical protein